MSGKRKKIIGLFILTVVLFGVFFGLSVKSTNAQIGVPLIQNPDGSFGTPPKPSAADAVAAAGTDVRLSNLMGLIFYYLVTALGFVIDKVLALMIIVGQFNNILDIDAVKKGWAIVRDLANNFFIIILLVIAVGTILRVPVYSDWKKLLPKLLIMSALINFSKMFAGLMIDFSQIVMLTFAYKIAEMSGKNIMLGALGFPNFFDITKLMTEVDVKKSIQEQLTGLGIKDLLGMLIIALVVGVVAIVVILVITVILVFRIIMFWFLVILSPLAFLASAFPKAQAYAKRWWDEMFKYLLVGPVMLFFLYLSLTVMMTLGESGTSALLGTDSIAGLTPGTIDPATGLTVVSGPLDRTRMNTMVGMAGLFNAIIVIGLLAGSLKVAMDLGVAGASAASGALGGLKRMGKAPLGWGKKGFGAVGGLAGGLALGGAKGAGRIALGGLKGLDALTGGKGGKAIGAFKSKGGAAGGAAAGAAIGTVMGGPVGTAIGAVIGAGVGALVGKNVARRLKTKRNVNKSRIDAQAEGDKGEFLDDGDKKLDYKTDEKEGVIYTENQLDANGEVIQGKEKGDKVTDVNDLKKIKKQWNNDKGFYEEKEANAYSGAPQNAEYVYKDATGRNVANKGGKLLDESGKITTENSKAKYQWITNRKRYEEAVYDSATDKLESKADKNQQKGVPDINGNRVHRWGEYKDEQGNVYRRKSEKNETYYRTGGKNEFVDKGGKATSKTEEMVAARGALGGNVEEISGPWATFMTGYLASTNKSVAAREAVENEKIEKNQKDYSGMSDAMLRKLLEVEGDSGKRMAIAMTLAIKNGFKDFGQVNKAKEALGGNSFLLKKFNEEINKRNMVMNNTRADGAIDEGAIAKLVSEGKAKWADQDTKNMSPKAYEVMAKQSGPKFHKELDDMNKNSRDLENIKNSLKPGLDKRGFTDEDLAIRKSYGSLSGNFLEAFTQTGVLNQVKLEEALSKISKPEFMDKVSEADLNNDQFKQSFAKSVDISMVRKMSRSQDISPEKYERFVEMIKTNNTALYAKMQAANDLIP